MQRSERAGISLDARAVREAGDMPGSRERARSFGPLAERYDRTRPSYPEEAVTVALPPGARQVADVGAGTGKLTSVLAALGLEVLAVEPDPLMAEVFSRTLPLIELRAGPAEALPLEDESCDAVFFGQSWHWADAEAAGREAARVLRPGGALVALWNVADDTTSWVRRLRELTGTEARLSDFRPPLAPPGFCRGHRQDTEATQHISREDLLELVGTWSAVSTLAPKERDGVIASVAQLLSDELSVRDNEEVVLPQVTITCWFHRR